MKKQQISTGVQFLTALEETQAMIESISDVVSTEQTVLQESAFNAYGDMSEKGEFIMESLLDVNIDDANEVQMYCSPSPTLSKADKKLIAESISNVMETIPDDEIDLDTIKTVVVPTALMQNGFNLSTDINEFIDQLMSQASNTQKVQQAALAGEIPVEGELERGLGLGDELPMEEEVIIITDESDLDELDALGDELATELPVEGEELELEAELPVEGEELELEAELPVEGEELELEAELPVEGEELELEAELPVEGEDKKDEEDEEDEEVLTVALESIVTQFKAAKKKEEVSAKLESIISEYNSAKTLTESSDEEACCTTEGCVVEECKGEDCKTEECITEDAKEIAEDVVEKHEEEKHKEDCKDIAEDVVEKHEEEKHNEAKLESSVVEETKKQGELVKEAEATKKSSNVKAEKRSDKIEQEAKSKLESIVSKYKANESAKLEAIEKEAKVEAKLESIVSGFKANESAKLEAIEKETALDDKLSSLVESYQGKAKAETVSNRQKVKDRISELAK